MPVCTEDLDKAIAEFTGTFGGKEEKSAELGHYKLYSKERHTGGLFDRLDGKSLLFKLLPGIWGRWATHDIYLVSKCCLF